MQVSPAPRALGRRRSLLARRVLAALAVCVATLSAAPAAQAAGVPAVKELSARYVDAAEPGQIFVRGDNLTGVTKVTVGGQSIQFGTAANASLWVTLPPHAPGKVDVLVTNAFGTSANTELDDLTYLGVDDYPRVTSVSPASGTQAGGTVLTLKGTHLAAMTDVFFIASGEYDQPGTNVQVISDNELRVTTPSSIYARDVKVSVSGWDTGSRPELEPTFSFTGPAGGRLPEVTGLSESNGPTSGYRFVEIKGRYFMEDPVQVTLGGDPVTFGYNLSIDPNWKGGDALRWGFLKLPHDAGTFDVRVTTSIGQSANTPADDYTIGTPTPSNTARSYGVSGTTRIGALTQGTVPVTGSLNANVDDNSGAFTGSLALDPATASLRALTVFPITASVAFEESGQTTGSLIGSALTVTTKQTLKITRMTLFGLDLVTGASCRTSRPANISLRQPSGFSWAAGGTVTGTFTISDLQGCGGLQGLVNPLTASGGNAIVLKLAPR